MSSYRPLGQFTQYFLDDGRVNAGGQVAFYETDLTTPKVTYSDPGLTTPNPNPVPLDAAGRPQNDIWGSGQYGAVLKDAAGVVLETRNHIQSGADAGFVIPPLETGKFLTNDGSNVAWDVVEQVPDPSGHSGNVLYSDGSLAYWGPLPGTPTPTQPDIVVGEKSFQAGTSDNANKFLILMGSDTAPASGSSSTSKSVSFAEEFTTLLGVFTEITATSYNTVGFFASTGVTGKSTTGFTFNAQVSAHQGGSGHDANINSSVPFDWVAFGIKNVVPPVGG